MKTPPLSLEQAQARLLALAAPVAVEHADIASALGHYLAEPLVARRTQPAADLSAMDGYAIGPGAMAGPWRIIGESAAGHPFPGSVGGGEAVRISTGALMPEGARSVILQEDVAVEGNHFSLAGEAPSPEDKHVRPAGLDFRTGETVLGQGARLGPAQIALAASAGYRHVPVHRRLRLALLDCGDELTDDCENCAPERIPASNGLMLAAMAASLPCEVDRLGPVPDTLADVLHAFERASGADVVVTSGGASVGDHDLIRPALEQAGAAIDFWRVAIKPGKPLLIATRERRRGRQVIVGLPGNPVSCHVTAYLFLLPLLRAMLGAADPLPRTIAMRLGAPMRAGGSRREFVRGRWDGHEVIPMKVQDSGALLPLAASNVLIDRQPGQAAGAQGDIVRAYLLGQGGMT